MSLQRIPHDATKYRNNPVELINISNRNRIGSEYALTANTKLLLQMNGTDNSTTFTDLCGKTVTAYGNAKISTARSIIGGSSGLFDGSGDYLTTPDSDDWDIPTNSDWTLDFWMYPADLTNLQFIIEASSGSSDNRWVVVLDTAGGFVSTNILIGYANTAIVGTPKTNLTINAWNHVAFVRESNNNWSVYINGNKKTTAAYSTAIIPTNKLCIGTYNSTTSYSFNGYLSHLRITKGQALWTANFTPPKFISDNYIGA